MDKNTLLKHVLAQVKSIPDMNNRNGRNGIMISAFFGSPILHRIKALDDSTETFALLLIDMLYGYGNLDSGKPALVVLLETLRDGTGVDKQNDFDQLIAEVYRLQPAAPTSDDIISALPEPSPNPSKRNHVFISYSHNDIVFVNRLAESLRRRGHVVWIDFDGVRGGDVWRQSIADGIHASAIVLVVVTVTSLQSQWVKIELETAKKFQKKVIPLLVDKLTIADQIAYDELDLQETQYRDFAVGYDKALRELLLDLPKPTAGLPGYCQKLIARLAEAPWGLDHYIQGESKLLPIHASPYDEGVVSRTSENLLRRLWQSKRTIVLGEPGMGKSVALERLAWELASNDPPIIPVIINLRECDDLPLLDWIRRTLRASNEQPLLDALETVADMEQFLRQSDYVFYLLLDGLNEVKPIHSDKIISEIKQLALEYTRHCIVVTSRVQDDRWRQLQTGRSFNGETVVVQPISPSQSQGYLAAHLDVDDASELWERRLDDRMRGLAATPLLLWMIKEAWLESRERIPGNRGELYANFIKRMLQRDDKGSSNASASAEKKMKALEQLAWVMHTQKIVSMSVEKVRAIITDAPVFDALLTNGLLQGDQNIRFAPHQTMQEHFAARAMEEPVMNRIRSTGLGRVFQIIRLNRGGLDFATDPWWWETFIQLAGLTKDGNELVSALADINPWLAWWCFEEGGKFDGQIREEIGNKSQALVYSPILNDRRSAVNALAKLSTPRIVPFLIDLAFDPSEEIVRLAGSALIHMSDEAVQVFIKRCDEKLKQMPVAKRAIWGRAIADHDPRPGVGLDERGRPDIDWVEIPAGEFIYQNRQILALPQFTIARYPITNAQFQAFIDAPDGFYHRESWRGLAVDEKHLIAPGNQRFKFGNHPRENVSWYDAVAFCRWLSDTVGYEVRLPTEQEWEYAARGAQGLVYPYGNEFDVNKGNTRETGIGQTSAVGIFPEGASSYGVMDMSGNVWEWCLNGFFGDDNRRQLSMRGGGWNDLGDFAHAAYRYGDDPNFRNFDIGFRVVRSPSLNS